MNNAERQLNIIEVILHGGPVIMLSYFVVTISGLILLVSACRSPFVDKRKELTYKTWIPFPCVASIFGVSYWFIQVKEWIGNCVWEPVGMMTGISDLMLLAFYGASVSTVVYCLSLLPQGVFHK